MELKDVILSTLAEMEDTPQQTTAIQQKDTSPKDDLSTKTTSYNKEDQTKVSLDDYSSMNSSDELLFLNSIRERLLVLFEGFQAPNNKNIEAKVDLTLNFLEYVLAMIDTRVEQLNKRK